MAIYKMKVTNEREETIWERSNIHLKIKFFWDSHGKLVDFVGFNDKKSFSKTNANVKIVKFSRELDGILFESWDLYLNEKKLNGEVYRYSYNPTSNNLNIKMIVGWG